MVNFIWLLFNEKHGLVLLTQFFNRKNVVQKIVEAINARKRLLYFLKNRVVQQLRVLVAGVLFFVTKVKTNLMEFEYNHLLKKALELHLKLIAHNDS